MDILMAGQIGARNWCLKDSDAAESGNQVLIFVSDLHLTGGARPSHEHDPTPVFARLVESLTGESGSG
jgi:hypothetical protein